MHQLCTSAATSSPRDPRPHPFGKLARTDSFGFPVHPKYGYPVDDEGEIYTDPAAQGRHKICEEIVPSIYPFVKLEIGEFRTVYRWSLVTMFTGRVCRATCIDRVPDDGAFEQPIETATPTSTPTPTPTGSPTPSPSVAAPPDRGTETDGPISLDSRQDPAHAGT